MLCSSPLEEDLNSHVQHWVQVLLALAESRSRWASRVTLEAPATPAAGATQEQRATQALLETPGMAAQQATRAAGVTQDQRATQALLETPGMSAQQAPPAAGATQEQRAMPALQEKQG